MDLKTIVRGRHTLIYILNETTLFLTNIEFQEQQQLTDSYHTLSLDHFGHIMCLHNTTVTELFHDVLDGADIPIPCIVFKNELSYFLNHAKLLGTTKLQKSKENDYFYMRASERDIVTTITPVNIASIYNIQQLVEHILEYTMQNNKSANLWYITFPIDIAQLEKNDNYILIGDKPIESISPWTIKVKLKLEQYKNCILISKKKKTDSDPNHYILVIVKNKKSLIPLVCTQTEEFIVISFMPKIIYVSPQPLTEYK